MEDTTLVTQHSEIRPSAEMGPIICCLDTSGSMGGARETVAKVSTRPSWVTHVGSFLGHGWLMCSGRKPSARETMWPNVPGRMVALVPPVFPCAGKLNFTTMGQIYAGPAAFCSAAFVSTDCNLGLTMIVSRPSLLAVCQELEPAES